jgi:hypothetical protein
VKGVGIALFFVLLQLTGYLQAIEVRVGPQGVKAKWVRIELRKVEALPMGGTASTFFDFVGPSPVNLWQSSDEYAMLQTASILGAPQTPEC